MKSESSTIASYPVIALHEHRSVENSDSDYSKLFTLDRAVAYLRR